MRDIYPEDSPACNKGTHSTMFIAALFIIARSWKEPRCPSMEEWIQKMWYIYTMEYYSDIKNNEFMKFLGKWVEIENVILSEVAQPQKNTHSMHSLISIHLLVSGYHVRFFCDWVTSLRMTLSSSIHLPKWCLFIAVKP